MSCLIFFIRCLKDKNIYLSHKQQIIEFNKMVFWINNMAAEYQNKLRKKNDT